MNKLFSTLLFLAFVAAYGQTQERVAIINTLDDYDSISVSALTYLTDKLRETAVNVLPAERFGVMTTESIVAFLGSLENTVRVCKESSCLAELGRMVSADYVAQGRIGRFGKDLTIKVELYNVKTGNLIGSFTGHSKDIYGFLTLIDEKAPIMFKNISDASNAKKTAPPPAAAPTPPPKPVTPPTPKPDIPPAPKEIPPPEAPIAKKNKEGEYDYTHYIQGLIDEDLEKNKEEIQKESFHITPLDRELLYEKNKIVSAIGSAALNVLPGFGLGSYIQGDIAFGVTQSVLELTTIMFVNLIWEYERKCYDDNTDCYNKYQKKVDTFGYIATGTILTNFAIGLIRPFVYQSKKNKALKEALNINDDYEENVENFSLSIDPLIVPRDGTPAVGLAFNVRY